MHELSFLSNNILTHTHFSEFTCSLCCC